MSFSIETIRPLNILIKEKPKEITELKPGAKVKIDDEWNTEYTIADSNHIQNGGKGITNGVIWPGSYVNDLKELFSPIVRTPLEEILFVRKTLIYTPSVKKQVEKEEIIPDASNK